VQSGKNRHFLLKRMIDWQEKERKNITRVSNMPSSDEPLPCNVPKLVT